MDIHEGLAIVAAVARIPVPDLEKEWDSEQYPHFYVLAKIQSGSIYAAQFNAAVIKRVPVDEIRKITFTRLRNMGARIPTY
jgi:hypothetical protein